MSLEERAKLTYDLLHGPLTSEVTEALESLPDPLLEVLFSTRALIREHAKNPKQS